ncbi:MAG: hypothetical protein ACT4PZ_02345 [Panacagrimonas sp.]
MAIQELNTVEIATVSGAIKTSSTLGIPTRPVPSIAGFLGGLAGGIADLAAAAHSGLVDLLT